MKKAVDRFFLISVIILAFFGLLIFVSASMGLLARSNVSLSSILLNHIGLGLILGSVIAFFLSKINYKIYKKYSFYFFVFSLLITLLVFVPGFGIEHGGAKRWLSIAGFSFQPSEFLKLGFVLYLAAWLSYARNHIHIAKYGLIPFVSLLGVSALVLVNQPDNGTIMVISLTAFIMFLVSGAKIKDIGILFIIGLIAVGGILATKPYVLDRFKTFLDPSDVQGSSYQIEQSKIAIGSGEVFGKGFGKSVQKFGLLPEPMGDSIFAVTAEEWGFIGTTFLIILFLIFGYRGFYIATKAPDIFASLLTIGFISLIIIQSFINMLALSGLFPLTGMPLIFVSQGGTALLFTLIEIGIILNISRYARI